MGYYSKDASIPLHDKALELRLLSFNVKDAEYEKCTAEVEILKFQVAKAAELHRIAKKKHVFASMHELTVIPLKHCP